MKTADCLVGVSDAVKSDPRVQRKLAEIDGGNDVAMAEIATAHPMSDVPPRLKMRDSTLSHKTMIFTIVSAFPMSMQPERDNKGQPKDGSMKLQPHCPSDFMPFIWLYTLAAPRPEVMRTVGAIGRTGVDQFMAEVYEWCDREKITADEFRMVTKAMEEVSSLEVRATEMLGISEKKEGRQDGATP